MLYLLWLNGKPETDMTHDGMMLQRAMALVYHHQRPKSQRHCPKMASKYVKDPRHKYRNEILTSPTDHTTCAHTQTLK